MQSKAQLDVTTLRWIMHLKNGKTVVENHSHGRTWRVVYKDNFQNIEALCFQKLPSQEKYYITPSPYNEYWCYEDFEVAFGGSTEHIARSICSLQEKSLMDASGNSDVFNVLTIDKDGGVTRSKQQASEIGYNSLSYVKK